MLNGMLGRKIGQTQIFDEKGTVTPVTVVQVGPMSVVQKKTVDNDGYDAVQMGFEDITEKKLSKPKLGHLKSVAPKRFLREFQVEDIAAVELGQEFGVSEFEEGQSISVSGTSKGKGFAGVIKRHNFAGQPRSHGHRGNRLTGSIGQRTFPGRTFKNKKMHGHMGAKKVTTLGLKIAKIIPEQSLVLVKGAVPGPNGGLVTILKSDR